jgi:lambda repressor-like predicted transcriptional regulator
MSGGLQESGLSVEGLQLLRAYIECSNEVQEGIRELLVACQDPKTSEDDRQMMLHSLADALFPQTHDGQLGLDLEASEKMGAVHSEETRSVFEEMDREEATFAARLAAFLKERSITQEELAARIGVGQPAISNMLSRQCRPQRRTVLRLAEALGVSPQELWPSFGASA